MNRLQSEWYRLYLPHTTADTDTEPVESGLIDGDGRVRAMALELARPADWDAVSKVWQGVQVDLELPAPAIAVSGRDGYQLWFSLAEPLPIPEAAAFLESLRTRYLGDVARDRVLLMPAADTSAPQQGRHAGPVPALQAQSGNWSAFVAPDLAPMFVDSPWLDIPPSPDGQADLLSGLDCIGSADFRKARERLGPARTPAGTHSALTSSGPTDAGSAQPGACLDPKRFLLEVMNDDAVALGLRIEAAKALLPYVDNNPDPEA